VADDAESGIASAQEVTCRFDDSPQHDRETELADDRGICPKESAQPALRGEHVVGAIAQLLEQLVEFQTWRVREAEVARWIGGW
jgi:hypothetical protein